MADRKSKSRVSKRKLAARKRVSFAYPLILFLLICSGVLLVAWTLKTSATDILVQAQVPAPAVTSPAVIASPAGGAHFSSIPVAVSGTCPANAAYVEIFHNNVMSGSAICDGSRHFALSTDLFAGQNSLVAHVFNVTDQEGPVSAPVSVFYDVPPNASENTGNSSNSFAPSNPNATAPLLIKTPFIYKGYYTGQTVDWPLEISGGVPPYAVNVDWGDSTNDLVSRSSAGEFDIHHTYKQSGNDAKSSYTVKVQVSDARSVLAYMQFFVIVNRPTQSGASAAGNIFSKPPPSLGGHSWLWVAWPAYGVTILMAISYLLGEKEEILTLRKKGILKR